MAAIPTSSGLTLSTLALAALLSASGAAQEPIAPAGGGGTSNGLVSMSHTARENFLATAKVLRDRPALKGTTNTRRVTLSDGTLTHDASVQTIEVAKPVFETPRGTELNFKDDWRFNVAAYRLDRLLELDMVPVTVERRFGAIPGSFTWWVDDVLMDEGERLRQKKDLPNASDWNQQMWLTRMFDQLIANVDRNLGNLLIDASYNIWMIDHSRSFRLNKALRSPENLSRMDRTILERLRRLDKPSVRTAVGRYLMDEEVDALLARRDAIIAHFDKASPVLLFDRRPR